MVGGSAAASPGAVDLDQSSPVVDAHQLAAEPHLHLLPGRVHVAEGTESEGVLAGYRGGRDAP